MHVNIEKDSPYYSEGQEPTLRPSFVCYADILGYSQLSTIALMDGKGNEFLRKLSSSLNSAYEKVRNKSKDSFFKDKPKTFDIKIFTDNIVIGYPVDNVVFSQGESELGDIFRLFCELQMALSLDGFFLRGGIAFGDHYMDNDVVFGDALLAAVKQDKVGGPPCLSLDVTVVKKIQGQLAFYGKDETHTPQHYYLREDSDGKLFINYLFQVDVVFPDGPLFFELINGHKNAIEHGLECYRSVPSVRAKYEWVARYHNYYCREVAKRYSGSVSDDDEKISETEEAQKMLNYIINIESFVAEPGPMTLKPLWHGGDD